MTVYEQHYYSDIAAIRRAIEEQNEILSHLLETLNAVLINQMENE